ncbi:MAG: MFS transporter [Bacteroidales bacterium]|nr:MFS transporter [Bacteroidales bacterium]
MQENWKKTFAFIWTGQLFSTLSSSVVSFAVIFWLSVQTGSAQVLALATISSLLPQLVLGLFTGVLIDRWDRKRTMIVADMYIALLTAVMAVLFYMGAAEIGFIYALLALRSIGSAFHMPAMEASVPLLAPKSELMRVAGINNMIFSVSTIGAPAIAAIFISALDMTWVLMFDVLGALIACTSLLFVKIPNPWDKKNSEISLDNSQFLAGKTAAFQITEENINESSKETSGRTNITQTEFKRFLTELNQGLHEILKRPGLMWMFIFTIFASLAMVPISTLFPLMTLDHFAGDTYKMSMVEIAWGVGMLIGGGIMSLPKFKFNNVLLINSMYVILGMTFAFSGLTPAGGFYAFVGFTLIGGVSGAIFWGAFTVLLQKSLDSSVLGRVFSIHNSLIMIPAMFSLIATGYIADNIGITNAFIISGAMLVFIGLLSPFLPAIQKFAKETGN